MAQSSIHIHMDSELKRQFEEFCSDVGLSASAAFSVFAKKVVQEYRIPFEIGMDVPNEETKAAIEEVQRMKADPSIGKCYQSVDSMMEDLLA